MMIGDRVRRQEAEGENNSFTVLATVVAVDGDCVGLNYDERVEAAVVHGWWPREAISEMEDGI